MDMESLEARVARVERFNRTLLVTLAIILAGVLVVGAGKTPGKVTSSSFELVDSDGRVRATLAMGEDGPLLALKDEAGTDRLSVAHAKDGTGVYISDETGTTRIGVAQFAHGGGGVALHGPDSKGAAVLYLKGSGSLRFFDTKGNVTTQLPPPVTQE